MNLLKPLSCTYINMQKIKISLLGLGVLSLGACTFSPIGDNKFDCNRKDAPLEYCRSVKAVLNSTDGALPDTKYGEKFNMEDYDIANGLSDKPGSAPKEIKSPMLLPHNLDAGAPPIAGAPVRQAPVIQKVFIKPFVDENDVLHEAQTAFKEVLASRWTGFDRQNTVSNLSGGVNYPHRSKDVAPVFIETADNGTDDSGHSQPEFTQPNPQGQVSNGANSPASTNGENSMPR